ncbi:hypothetical protein [Nocardia nepalensis]|uniref:hypothetical protein n=1 Tax=Nocardia nepalensis TaxID=3375448 RepID=UPI003B671779
MNSLNTAELSLGRGPCSPLDVVRASFEAMAAEPVIREAVLAAGLELRELRLDGLRDVLLDPGLPIATVDAVWVCLVERSRVHGGNATMACAGLALPVLAAISARLSSRWAGDRADIEAAVLCGFLAELGRIDLSRPWVLHRLRWAAYRSGYACMRERQDAPAPAHWVGRPTSDESSTRQRRLMRSPDGHPELVLTQAVDAGVVTSAQARLIALTRLQRRSLTSVAAERDTSYKALHQVRRRAEQKLVAYLAERARDLDPTRTSTVEAQVLISPTRADRTRRPVVGTGRGGPATSPVRGPLSKPARKSGVKVRGSASAAPAYPTSEVPRCA